MTAERYYIIPRDKNITADEVVSSDVFCSVVNLIVVDFDPNDT
jgi:hypothetical protein